MDEYRVKYWCEDGAVGYVSFNSYVLARAFYDSLDGMAEIQKWDKEHRCYDAEEFPIFEY